MLIIPLIVEFAITHAEACGYERDTIVASLTPAGCTPAGHRVHYFNAKSTLSPPIGLLAETVDRIDVGLNDD